MTKKTITIVAAAVATIGLGYAAGASTNNSAQEAAHYAATHPVVAPTPMPTATVTKTAPAKPAPTVSTTTTVSVATVPQACLDALDNADQGFTYASQIITAAGEFDVATMNAVTEKVTALAPKYNANKAACRAAGGQ